MKRSASPCKTTGNNNNNDDDDDRKKIVGGQGVAPCPSHRPAAATTTGTAAAAASPVYVVTISGASAADCGARPDQLTSRYEFIGVFTTKTAAYKAGIVALQEQQRWEFVDNINTTALLKTLPTTTTTSSSSTASSSPKKKKLEESSGSARTDDKGDSKDDDDEDDVDPSMLYLMPDSQHQDFDEMIVNGWMDCPDNGYILYLARNDPYEGEFLEVSITKSTPKSE